MDVLGQKPVFVSLGQPAWDHHGPPLENASNQLHEHSTAILSAVSEK